MSGRFTGKVFMVTGASSGIGEVIAKKLAADGAHVVLTARRAEKLAAVKTEIEANGGSTSVKVMDVSDYDQVETTVKSIVAELGHLDGAFNNAGGSGPPGTVADLDVVDFKQVFDLNFYGTYHCMKAELQVMLKQGSGSIVNNLSFLAGQHMGMQSHYGCSKAALKYLQESAALEAAPSGVRVNSVSPGFTLPSEAIDAFIEAVPAMKTKLNTPQGKMVHADEVYPAVAFLFDGAMSSAITGTDMPVSGGLSVAQVTMSDM